MKLSEIAYNDIHAGDIVVSDQTGNRGVISFVAEYLDENNNPWVKISWSNGNVSIHPFTDDDMPVYHKVTYIGKE